MMERYDPVLARKQAIELRAKRETHAIEVKKSSEKEEEKAHERFLRSELEAGDNALTRFDQRLLNHITQGYSGSVEQGTFAKEKDAVEVEVLLRNSPREETVHGRVYSEWDSLGEIISDFQKLPATFKSVQLLLNKLDEHPAVARIISGILERGLEPVVGHQVHYGHEGGYEGRSFHDWSGVYILAKLPSQTDNPLWWEELKERAEASLAEMARAEAAKIPERAIERLVNNQETLKIASLSHDRTGFNHRTEHKFRDLSGRHTYPSYQYGGKNASAVQEALKKDPYYGVLLKELRERQFNVIIDNGEIVVRL